MIAARHVLLCPLLLILSVIVAFGQNPYDVETRPVRGFMPNMDQLSSPVDHIDPVSRKLHLEIPLASLPQGPGGSGFDLSLVYDTHYWNLEPEAIHPPPPWDMIYSDIVGYKLSQQWSAQAGWNLNIDNVGIDFEERVSADPNYPSCLESGPFRLYRLRARLLDGSLHVMHLKGWGPELGDGYNGDGFFPIDPSGRAYCRFPNGDPAYTTLYTGLLTYFSNDGSYLKLEIYADGSGNWGAQPWTLYLPDGRRITGGASQGTQLYDANGNRIRVVLACYDPPPNGNCSHLYRSIVDDAGHEIRLEGSGDPFTGLTTTATTDGPNGPMTWTMNWELFELGLDGRQYTMAPNAIPLPWDTSFSLHQYGFGLKYVQLPLAPAVPASQSPPVWNSYAFGYADDADDGYGEVDTVRTPTGATFRYRFDQEGPGPVAAETIANDNTVRERRVSQDGQPDLVWTYSGGFDLNSNSFRTQIINPDMSQATYWYGPQGNYLDTSISINIGVGKVVYRIDEPNGSVRKRLWSQNRVVPSNPHLNYYSQNAWVKRETQTVGNSAGVPALTKVTERTIDKNGNLLQSVDYDWVGYDSSGPEVGSTVKRTTQQIYYAESPDYASASDDPQAYWNVHYSPLQAGQSRRLNAVQRKEVRDGSGTIAAVTEFEYDDPYRTGNVTAEKRWDSVKSPGAPGPGALNSSNAQVLRRSYGASGNIEDIYEPEVRTHITYDATGSVPTRVDYAYGTSAQRSWTYDWNVASGTLLSKTDLDNNLTTSYTYDTVGRPLTVIEAGLRKTETIYDDANRKVTAKEDLISFGDGKLETTTEYDQLGRTAMTRTSEPGNPDGIKKKSTFYSALNRMIQSSPYRATDDATLEWTCTQTDASKRVTAVAVFKGSTEPADCESISNRTAITRTIYDGNTTTVIDPAGKARQEVRDGLGRLIQVIEDPSGLNYSTSYNYDALDNLIQVLQGVQTRTFQYSSLGKLTAAANPESGIIAYSYTDAGDMATRTDARGVVASHTYDPLRRIQTRSYSDSTPAVTYTYYLAGAAPKVGQLQSVFSSAASNQNASFDALGRVTSSSHTIAGDSATRSFVYTYWLNNSVKTVTNPSGRVLNYDVDDAGRTVKVSAGGTTYADLTTASSTAYTADGRIAQVRLGNNLWETRVYQTPGSPTLFQLGTTAGSSDRLELEYNFPATANNGNLESHAIRQPGRSWTQSYSYDGVNRLTAANEAGGWSRSYGYDLYGNRWVSGSSGLQWTDSHEPASSSNFNVSNNRLSVAGSTFDAAGNQTTFSPWTLGYDAENRNVSLSSGVNGAGTFAYDGVGRRVKKSWTPSGGGPTTTYYLYNALGQLAAEYSTQSATPNTSYIHTDMLRSTRMVTDASGATLECYDYLPFGRLLSNGVNNRNTGCYPPNPDTQIVSKLPQKFTGKERDDEARLDYFGARYYSASQGRFTSADSVFADQHPENPQSWNLYQYGFNNPLNNVDLDGHSVWTKALKLLLKGGDVALTVQGVVEDFKTASNPDLPLTTRLWADASLLSEVLPVSIGDLKDAGRALGFAEHVASRADDAKDTIRVIGHKKDDYVEIGKSMGAKVHDVPDEIWKIMSKEERWSANVKFMDRGIKAKARFMLVTHRDAVIKPSILNDELNYLLSQGYQWSDDGWSLFLPD